jgi:hypothetical protein
MLLLRLLEVSIAIVIAILFLTEVLVPLFRGRPLFPSFRKNSLQDEVDEMRAKVSFGREKRDLTNELKSLKDEAKSLKK